MTFENWTDLKDLQTIADAQSEKWEIQYRHMAKEHWNEWSGTWWNEDSLFRGRPRQQAIVYSCFDVDGQLMWFHPMRVIHPEWTRIPQFDKIVEAAE
jgi:hypothetical protein